MRRVFLTLLFATIVLLGGCNKEEEYDHEITLEHVLYENGIYHGTTKGHRGNVTRVIVEISSNQIISVEIKECGCTPIEEDNDFYINAAIEVADSIVIENHTEIDSISGATETSEAIILAVKNALHNALVK